MKTLFEKLQTVTEAKMVSAEKLLAVYGGSDTYDASISADTSTSYDSSQTADISTDHDG